MSKENDLESCWSEFIPVSCNQGLILGRKILVRFFLGLIKSMITSASSGNVMGCWTVFGSRPHLHHPNTNIPEFSSGGGGWLPASCMLDYVNTVK